MCCRIPPGRPNPVDDGFREEDAVVGRMAERLVRVQVVTLAHSMGRRFLSDEVEGRIDLILTIREEELHDANAIAGTPSI